MATQFLKKYKLNSSLKTRVQDFELIHPINKSIKPTQVYLDSEIPVYSRSSEFRTSSQDHRNFSSIVLQPIPRPRHVSAFTGDSSLKRSENKSKFTEEEKKSSKKDHFLNQKEHPITFRIRSPKNLF
jgi:hypothetical protein